MALAAIAASTAEPPARSTSTPADDASECGVVTRPCVASVWGRPVLMSKVVPCFPCARDGRASATNLADHVAVVGSLADLIPLDLLVAERDHGIIELLEPLVLARKLGKELGGRLVRGVENFGRERPELCAIGDQALDRLRVARVIFRR